MKGGAKKSGSKKKRGLNKYFKLMTDARKNNLKSFEYNGKTYHRMTNPKKPHLIFYKAK